MSSDGKQVFEIEGLTLRCGEGSAPLIPPRLASFPVQAPAPTTVQRLLSADTWAERCLCQEPGRQ